MFEKEQGADARHHRRAHLGFWTGMGGEGAMCWRSAPRGAVGRSASPAVRATGRPQPHGPAACATGPSARRPAPMLGRFIVFLPATLHRNRRAAAVRRRGDAGQDRIPAD